MELEKSRSDLPRKIVLLYERANWNGYVPAGVHPKNLKSDGQYDSNGGFTGIKPDFWLRQLLKWSGVNFEEKMIFEDLSSSDENWLVIEPEWMDRCFYFENFFHYLSPKTIHLLRNKQIKLVIFYPNEGYSLSNSFFPADLHKAILRSNIPAEVVHLVFGEENFKRNYAHWLTKGEHHGVKLHNLYNITVMDIYYRMKFDELYYGPKSIPSQLLEPTPRLLQSKRPYHFLSLNAVPRPHRTLFVSELERRNLDTHGIISFLGRYHRPTEEILRWFDRDSLGDALETTMRDAVSRYIQNWKPRVLDLDSNQIGSKYLQLDAKMFSSSYFSVVTETIFETGDFQPLFITEKSFKPFINLHPLLVLGPTGVLEYLRSQGYETFPELFDESYDEEPHWQKRMRLVLRQVEALCSLSIDELHRYYASIWDKLVHNRSTFLETATKKSSIISLLSQITAAGGPKPSKTALAQESIM